MKDNLRNRLVADESNHRYLQFCQYHQSQPVYPIVIFGSGDIGMMTKKILSENGIPVFAFCDNDITKQGMIVKGVRVIAPSALRDMDHVQVIVNDSYYSEKHRQLLDMGIKENNIWRFDAFNFLYKNFTGDYIFSRYDSFAKTYSWLEDAASKTVFAGYLNGVITGDLAYYEQVMTNDEYFPKDLLPMRSDHVFVDVGAYNGNTSLEFIDYFNGKYEKIYAFEPLESSANLIDRKKIPKLQLCRAGASDRVGTVDWFCNDYGDLSMLTTVQAQGAKDKMLRVKTETIDHVLAGGKATFIKMDIEGSELSALQGAREMIQKYRPFLAVCVYHKKEDLIEIPTYIHTIMPQYKMYLRHHSNTAADLVLYCV